MLHQLTIDLMFLIIITIITDCQTKKNKNKFIFHRLRDETHWSNGPITFAVDCCHTKQIYLLYRTLKSKTVINILTILFLLLLEQIHRSIDPKLDTIKLIKIWKIKKLKTRILTCRSSVPFAQRNSISKS